MEQPQTMSMLRNRLVRLAYEEPDIRKAVMGLLRVGDLVFVSNAARKAFEAELLPQIETAARTPAEVETVRAHLHSLLADAMREKNGLYLLLIRYKSNDAGDAAYFADLNKITDEWARDAMGAPAPVIPAPVPAPVIPAPVPAPAPVLPQVPQVVMAPMPMMPVPALPPQPSTTTTTITTVKQGRRSKNR